MTIDQITREIQRLNRRVGYAISLAQEGNVPTSLASDVPVPITINGITSATFEDWGLVVGNGGYQILSDQILELTSDEGNGSSLALSSFNGAILSVPANKEIEFLVGGSLIFRLNGTFGNYANDAGAQAAGVPVKGLYHTAGVLKIRLI